MEFTEEEVTKSIEVTIDRLKSNLNECVNIMQDRIDELQERINKAIDKLYLYGETLNPKFQQEMLAILKGKN